MWLGTAERGGRYGIFCMPAMVQDPMYQAQSLQPMFSPTNAQFSSVDHLDARGT